LIGRSEPNFKTVPDMTRSLLAFSTPKDSPGSLLSVLEIFKDHQINLSKILSRPEKSDMGSYIFFVEFPTTFDDILLTQLFSKIKEKSQFFKHLGTYRNRGFHD
jgi:prephenate dehydratase